MKEIAFWLIGIVIAMAGAGFSLYQQGRTLEAPKQREIIAKRCKRMGICWIVMALLFAIMAVVFVVLS